MNSSTTTREAPKSPSFWRDPLLAVRDEVDAFLSHIADRDFLSSRFTPHFDLSETDDALEVRMDVPGVKPDEIDIVINGNMLTISGERKAVTEKKGCTFHRVERRAGAFSRSVMLPCAVEEDQVEATSVDGVLSLLLPKTSYAKRRKSKVKV